MASFSATLPSKIALTSGSEPLRFPILSHDFEAKFWSEIVPAVQEKGFLKMETTNAFDLPLMPGQAQIFIDWCSEKQGYRSLCDTWRQL